MCRLVTVEPAVRLRRVKNGYAYTQKLKEQCLSIIIVIIITELWL
jgi:hypothetical protein